LCRHGYTVDYYHPGMIKSNSLTSIRHLNTIMNAFYTGRQIKDFQNYNLVISNGGYGFGVKKIKGVKYLNFHHGTAPGLYDKIKLKVRWKTYLLNKYFTYGMIEFLSGINSTRVAVGHNVQAEVRKYFHGDSHLLCNAVDTGHFNSKRDKKAYNDENLTCLFVARYDYWIKGFDFLEKLLEQLKNVNWIIIAGGKHNLRVPDNAKVYENISYNDLPRLYQMADIGFYLSRYEGNSYSLLECLSCKLPVIATPSGEAKYIYQNEILNGLLIKSSIDTKDAIEEVKLKVDELRDANKRAITGMASRKIIEEHYSLEKWEQGLSQIIDETR
jgi:glycosyltransferase involved in cell wall biosynthesis